MTQQDEGTSVRRIDWKQLAKNFNAALQGLDSQPMYRPPTRSERIGVALDDAEFIIREMFELMFSGLTRWPALCGLTVVLTVAVTLFILSR